MGISIVNTEDFILLQKKHPVFDVRSPGEFSHASIPEAYSLPLFSDEERALVGTAYKQQSRSQAIKLGLEFYGKKMRGMVEEVELHSKSMNDNASQIVLVHCWRGGMRSSAVAWLLDLYGFKVYTLQGGYKSYRNWVLKQFEGQYTFNVLGGYTGSGKTIVLEKLREMGHSVIDLEALANHKGSAFGALGEKEQPSQEMFENLLALELFHKANNVQGEGQCASTWLEDESQRIGSVTIPGKIWNSMRASPLYFLTISFEERLNYLVDNYGKYKQELLVAAIMRIQKRLGGLETKNAINYLLENNITESFSILLKYYDKLYSKGLHNRENLDILLHDIRCALVNPEQNALEIINEMSLSSTVKIRS